MRWVAFSMVAAVAISLAQVEERNGWGVFGFDLEMPALAPSLSGDISCTSILWRGEVNGVASGAQTFALDKRTGEIRPIARGAQMMFSPDPVPVPIFQCLGDTVYALEALSIDSLPTRILARWDGQRWQTLSSQTPWLSGGSTHAVKIIEDTLYVTGLFSRAGNMPVGGMAKLALRTGQWSPWGTFMRPPRERWWEFGVSGLVENKQRRLIAVVGEFPGVNGDSCEGIALYDRWQGRWEVVRGRWEGRFMTTAVFVGQQLWVSGWGRFQRAPIAVYDVKRRGGTVAGD